MLTVNVSSNYKKLSRSLDQVGKKQLPFAFAKTLNQTMKAVAKYTVARTYPRAFDVRNRAFFRAAMFTGSAVKQATTKKLRVSARDEFDRLGFAAGNVVKYVIRYEEKGGVVDLEKARWYLDRLIDEEISG